MKNIDGTRWYPSRWLVVVFTVVMTAGLSLGFFWLFENAEIVKTEIASGTFRASTEIMPLSDTSTTVAKSGSPTEARQQGMRVAIDPETGEFITPPPVAQSGELPEGTAQSMQFSSEGLVEEHHPDGSVSINLKGRFRSEITAHLDENGKLVYECSSHPAGTPHPKAAAHSGAPQ